MSFIADTFSKTPIKTIAVTLLPIGKVGQYYLYRSGFDDPWFDVNGVATGFVQNSHNFNSMLDAMEFCDKMGFIYK